PAPDQAAHLHALAPTGRLPGWPPPPPAPLPTPPPCPPPGRPAPGPSWRGAPAAARPTVRGRLWTPGGGWGVVGVGRGLAGGGEGAPAAGDGAVSGSVPIQR